MYFCINSMIVASLDVPDLTIYVEKNGIFGSGYF